MASWEHKNNTVSDHRVTGRLDWSPLDRTWYATANPARVLKGHFSKRYRTGRATAQKQAA